MGWRTYILLGGAHVVIVVVDHLRFLALQIVLHDHLRVADVAARPLLRLVLVRVHAQSEGAGILLLFAER